MTNRNLLITYGKNTNDSIDSSGLSKRSNIINCKLKSFTKN